MENDIFILKADISDLLRSRIGNELITRKKISSEIFQCGLYVSNLLSDLIGKVPPSYYASDYLIRGFEEEKPEVVKEGADLCAVVCIFFDDDQLKKVIRKRKYDYFGTLLYLRYYYQTGKPIAWHMSNNFKEITAIARNSIQSL